MSSTGISFGVPISTGEVSSFHARPSVIIDIFEACGFLPSNCEIAEKAQHKQANFFDKRLCCRLGQMGDDGAHPNEIIRHRQIETGWIRCDHPRKDPKPTLKEIQILFVDVADVISDLGKLAFNQRVTWPAPAP